MRPDDPLRFESSADPRGRRLPGDAATAQDPRRLGRDRYRALVIGSGFGGSVMACRLAQGGVDVGIVERGRHWPPGTFPRGFTRLDGTWLWARGQGLFDARPLNDILAICAAGYGGGSLVYANVAMRPPAEVFDDAWPAPYGRASLDPYYDLVADMLDVTPTPPDARTRRLPPKALLMREGARRMGREEGWLLPNVAVSFGESGTPFTNAFGATQRGCTYCGECDIGCNQGAKNTLDLTYLAAAETSGADVGVLTEAVHITLLAGDSPGGPRGYRVRLRELSGTRTPPHERDVVADEVFVCAGAIGSTELLLRSRDQYRTLPDLPRTLGHGFSGNGDFLAFGRGVRPEWHPTSGPTITTATVMRAEGVGRDQWYVMEDGGYSQHLAALVRSLDLARAPRLVAAAARRRTRALLATSRTVARGLEEDTAHTAVLLMMGRDRADGRIEVTGRRHRLRVRWDVVRNDPLYAAERAAARAMVRALGGQPFGTPTWQLLRQPVTVHNLGGCRMSEDPAHGVTDPDGQVHGHPGLYVVDGAMLPGATGANPSMTIAAVAERCAEVAVRRLTDDQGWTAPPCATARRRQVPEDAAVRRVVTREGADAAPGPGLRFRERMQGTVGAPGEVVRHAAFRLTVTIDDLSIFLADPQHRARVDGGLHVAGLTRHPVRVQDGTVHLLAPATGGRHPRARTMTYRLPFTADDGTIWVLHGAKDVSWRRGHGPWRATTSMPVTLQPAAKSRAPSRATELAGSVSLSPWEVGRLALSVRPLTGARTSPPAWWPIARFAAFFAREAAGALLPARPTPRRGGGTRSPVTRR